MFTYVPSIPRLLRVFYHENLVCLKCFSCIYRDDPYFSLTSINAENCSIIYWFAHAAWNPRINLT